jgi:hypothetical protein
MSLRRRMGPAPRMRPAPRGRPAHAGRLALWERLAFGLVFALMAAFVVVVAISSGRDRQQGPPSAGPSDRRDPGSAARAVPPAGSRKAQALEGGASAWDHRLAVALRPVLRGAAGSLAVGVIDRSTGAVAVYRRGLRVPAASIVKADILAALLLQRQRQRPALSNEDEDLASRMITGSDQNATTRLWRLAGAADGIAAANARLRLEHTTPDSAGSWGATITTVGDQLALLTDLTAAGSALTSGARAYELGLMQNVGADQRWGISAAASPGSAYALRNGWWQERPAGSWVVNSIGVLEHGGQQLLMAVLSDDQPSRATGIVLDDAAVVAAAECITSAG